LHIIDEIIRASAGISGGVENIKIDKSPISLACRAVARGQSPPSPRGFGVAAFTRFASEGWWARQDSNQEPDRYERQTFDRFR
jgi:hypothetical protein